ncbi:hypothetical protein [Streptomyces sp. NPDC056527]|uniref:hypothetical protein n=1 Tax=Streptomyces sp. NPDC056527 TaxID=3345853 RepID=UPI0036B7CA0E
MSLNSRAAENGSTATAGPGMIVDMFRYAFLEARPAVAAAPKAAVAPVAAAAFAAAALAAVALDGARS